MLSFLRDLTAHCEWANGVFFHCWGKSSARDHEELRRRVAHILDVLAGFNSIIRGQGPVWPKDTPIPTYDELKTRARDVHKALGEFTAAADEAALAKKVNVPWFQNPPLDLAVADGLIQAAMHTQYHRGQCMTRLKDFGGEPKNTDWIIYLWKQKPAARWE